MTRRDLLPGVTTVECPPVAVIDSFREIRRARRIAFARDAAQLILLAGVDFLFFHWPETHIPTLERHTTLLLLGGVNGAMLSSLWLQRVMPRWTARRIASTWCVTEQSRFFRRDV